jgi:hypothetical protein
VNDIENEEFDPALEDEEPEAGTALEGGRGEDEPDVLLDVPELRVDEISLEVEDLRARVALQADVLQLLKLHVGVEAELGRVQLTIKGVEAQALLKVRLDNVARIIDRVLGAGAGSTVEEVGTEAGSAVGEVSRGAGRTVEEAGRGAAQAVDDVAGETRQKRPRDSKARRQRTDGAAEGRSRRRKADSPPKRSAKSSRRRRDRQSEEE